LQESNEPDVSSDGSGDEASHSDGDAEGDDKMSILSDLDEDVTND
jgi:hypothetical protein